MKNKMKIILYDFKEMGLNAFLPIIIATSLGFFCTYVQGYPDQIMHSFELFIPPFSAWWIIQSFYNYIDETGCEIYFSYPTSRIYIGLVKTLILYFLYLLIIFIPISITKLWETCDIFSFYIVLVTLSLFFSSCGFYLIVHLRNTLLSFGLILIYIAFNILYPRGIILKTSVYFYSTTELDIKMVLSKIILLLILSLIILINAQLHFSELSQK